MLSRRLLFLNGILAAALGVGCAVPATVEWFGPGALERPWYAIVAVGLLLTVGGAGLIASIMLKRRESILVPAPVRAVLASNVLFLAFCALETSDGLVRQGGRLVYWTSFLFLPALTLFYGQVLARRWAWWIARILAALAVLWFVGFIALIPYADLRTADGPVPWYGRLYMAGVSLAFAAISAYAFKALGCASARSYFGLASRA